MKTPNEELESYVRELSSLVGHENSIYSLVLRYGKFFNIPVLKLPSSIRAGKMKECYRNAFINMSSKYIYTEGLAMIADVPMGFEHAWLTDKNGNIYDPTWTDGRGVAYYGIQFRAEYVLEVATKTRVTGIMTNNYGIVREGLPGHAFYR